MDSHLLLVFPAAYDQFQPLKLQRNELLADVEVGPVIGTGSYGKVFRGTFLVICSLEWHLVVVEPQTVTIFSKLVLLAGRWQGASIAIKQIKHEAHPDYSSVVVAQECIAALILAHPNHVRHSMYASCLLSLKEFKYSEDAVCCFIYHLQKHCIHLCNIDALYR